MSWGYAAIGGLFVLGVLLAFPLAIGMLWVFWSVLVRLDHFTAYCPGFSHVRRWHQSHLYRPGRIVSRFLAADVRRDVEVVDASRIDNGMLAVRTRTWNVLYALKDLSPEPPFGEVRTVALSDLWVWTAEPWGDPVSEADR